MSIHVSPQIIPPGAPFSDAERARLNRFFAEVLARNLPITAFLDSDFVMVFAFSNGKVVRFQEFSNSAAINAAYTAA